MGRLRRPRVRVFDVLVVGVAVAAELEIVLRDLYGPQWLLLTAVWWYTLPLLARRRWPLAAPLFVIVVQVVVSFLDVPGSVRENWGVVAYVLAFWVLASDNTQREAILGLLVGLAGIVVVALEDPRVLPREAFSVAVYATLTWLAGLALRQRNLRVAEAERRSAALEQDHRETQAAVAEERARIARELHDVVAHSVSVMTVQAGAARMMLATDPDRALAPLLAVEETGRQALDELRRLLGILRPGQAEAGLVPQPGLDDLPELVESVRATGLPVELITDGVVRPIAPGLGLTAYRIVQEALTNTLKHAAAHEVRVLVDYGAQQLHVEVRDDGCQTAPPNSAEPGGPSGHGLAGMRERAALYGGELQVGPGEDGGYVVSTYLPIGRPAS
ncbi:MAG TPA: sensor histidine kinase [Nocardioides sp.]|nr:sensor histidine kinase [Nocardioides sp.]